MDEIRETSESRGGSDYQNAKKWQTVNVDGGAFRVHSGRDFSGTPRR
jgi:hypothetical protein